MFFIHLDVDVLDVSRYKARVQVLMFYLYNVIVQQTVVHTKNQSDF